MSQNPAFASVVVQATEAFAMKKFSDNNYVPDATIGLLTDDEVSDMIDVNEPLESAGSANARLKQLRKVIDQETGEVKYRNVDFQDVELDEADKFMEALGPAP